VRTTVTIDPDTEALIREEAARTGQSFKVILNQSVRRALGPTAKSGSSSIIPIFPAAFPESMTEGNFNRLAAEWEDEDTVKELSS
jgi:hypothetical protein